MERLKKYIISFVLVFMMCVTTASAVMADTFVGVKIHVINVGAGDSILIEYDDANAKKHYALIDGGYASQNMRNKAWDTAYTQSSDIEKKFGEILTQYPTDATQKTTFITDIQKLFEADAALGTASQTDVVRYLNAQGVTTLDYVVGTHPHWDHIGGLCEVATHFTCKNFLWSSGGEAVKNSEETYKNFYQLLQDIVAAKADAANKNEDTTDTTDTQKIDASTTTTEDQSTTKTTGEAQTTDTTKEGTITSQTPSLGDTFTLGDKDDANAPKFTCLTDTKTVWDQDKKLGTNLNNYSLVYRMSYGTRTAIFSGDAEQAAQNAIMAYAKDQNLLSADIYKVSHHGNSNPTHLTSESINDGYTNNNGEGSGNYQFVKAIDPTISLVSCEKDDGPNMKGGSQPTTRTLYDLKGSDVYVTKPWTTNETGQNIVCSVTSTGDMSVSTDNNHGSTPFNDRRFTYTSSDDDVTTHYTTSKVSEETIYDSYTIKDITFGFSGKQIYYKLVNDGSAFTDDNWTAGNSVTVNAPFHGTIYLKGYDRNNNAIIRKTDDLNVIRAVTGLTGISNTTYSASYKTQAVTVYSGSTVLAQNNDYTISYSNNLYPGKATIKVTGINNYAGSVSSSFVIYPHKVTLKTGKSTGKKKLYVKYTKATKVSGYQIAYRKKGSSSWKYKTTSSTSQTITGLSRKKYYYVKIRSYKTISGKKYYSSYSNQKKVKIR